MAGEGHYCMNIGDEVEVTKRGDPNDGREGKVAALPRADAIDVSFEGGTEQATYKPKDLQRVRPRIPPGMQNNARSRWEDFWNVG